MKENKLAIIIPAYKTEYLKHVFDSVSQQTCKDFNLYVFDDNSPYDILSIYNAYFSKWKNARYFRFEENLGGKDLAAHWYRCVKGSGIEEWVWLFSDDDLMTQNCVEEFYKALNNKQNQIDDVLHFNICQIDDNGDLEYMMPTYPQNISAADYYSLLHTGLLDTRMPEFIFRRSKLKEIGGYVSFDMAWKSDNATVTAMTYPGTIYTFPEGMVSWRLSKKNITGVNMDDVGEEKKRLATIDYFNWNYHFFKDRGISCGLTDDELFRSYFLFCGKKKVYKYHIREVLKFAQCFDYTRPKCKQCQFLLYWIRTLFLIVMQKINRTWMHNKETEGTKSVPPMK